jgi:hypothetical protein
MKQQLNGAWRCIRKSIANSNLLNGSFSKTSFFALLLIMCSLFLISFQKEAVHDHEEEMQIRKSAVQKVRQMY